MTEAVQATSRSTFADKRWIIQQFDGGNISSSSCDTSRYEGIPPTTIPASPPTLAPPTLAPPMTALPAPELPVAAPPTPPPWSVHLPSYPPRVICRFCFKDSHEVKNCKCWDSWKKSDQNKAIAALDEAKMKNPTALHRSKCYCKLCRILLKNSTLLTVQQAVP